MTKDAFIERIKTSVSGKAWELSVDKLMQVQELFRVYYGDLVDTDIERTDPREAENINRAAADVLRECCRTTYK